MIEKIVSGGQTGVDRAALDAAIELGIPHGGWCPKGRLAELGGIIPTKYSLKETNTSNVDERTKLNIQDADGTLILVPQVPLPSTIKDGTLLTISAAKAKQRPCLVVDLAKADNIQLIIDWARKNNIKTLNIAGPRESSSPGIYQQSLSFLKTILPYLTANSGFKARV